MAPGDAVATGGVADESPGAADVDGAGDGAVAMALALGPDPPQAATRTSVTASAQADRPSGRVARCIGLSRPDAAARTRSRSRRRGRTRRRRAGRIGRSFVRAATVADAAHDPDDPQIDVPALRDDEQAATEDRADREVCARGIERRAPQVERPAAEPTQQRAAAERGRLAFERHGLKDRRERDLIRVLVALGHHRALRDHGGHRRDAHDRDDPEQDPSDDAADHETSFRPAGAGSRAGPSVLRRYDASRWRQTRDSPSRPVRLARLPAGASAMARRSHGSTRRRPRRATSSRSRSATACSSAAARCPRATARRS